MTDYLYCTAFTENYPNGFVLYQSMCATSSPSVSWLMIP
jgi:hypothetical protein